MQPMKGFVAAPGLKPGGATDKHGNHFATEPLNLF